MTIILIIGYVMFVVGGWFNLRPIKLIDLPIGWHLLYQLPTNYMIFCDRVFNVTIASLIILCVPEWRKRSPAKWETISSRLGRDFKGSLTHAVIDLLMLDWARGDRPGHCVKYIGV